MITVRFYEEAPPERIRFSVILSRYQGKWVFCKHKLRDTYEIPGGHREEGETPVRAAERELYEETGAREFTLRPVCAYSVADTLRDKSEEEETFGMLFFAEITAFGLLPAAFEMEKVELFEEGSLPQNWTYPEIQPKLMEKGRDFLKGMAV